MSFSEKLSGKSLRDAHFGHTFNMVEGMHPTALRRVYKSFESFEAAWNFFYEHGAAAGERFAKAGLTDWLVRNIVDALARRAVSPAAAAEELEKEGIRILCRKDDGFPLTLRGLRDAPALLYQRGASIQPDQRYVAIVGTRDPSSYGEAVTQELAAELCSAGAVVVSGMAVGVDSIAHTEAVKQGLPTVAVVACGLGFEPESSVVFAEQQRMELGNGGGLTYRQQRLAEQILAAGGTLLSENHRPPAYKGQFLERNRIISGLCEATIVVEAGEQSGALSTAQFATEQNRMVYAVPGDIYRAQAQGPLGLLSDENARICVNATQLLDELGFPPPSARRRAKLEGDFLALFSALQKQPLSFEGLVRKTHLSPENVNVGLTVLESQKLVTKRADGLWWNVR